MAINKKLIHFKTKALFLGPNGISMYTSATILNRTTLNSKFTNTPDNLGIIGNVPWNSLISIEDTNEIWTHGVYIGSHEPTVTIQPVHTKITSNWPIGTTNDNLPGAEHTSHSGDAPNALWALSGTNGLLDLLGSGSYVIQILHTTDTDGGIYTGYFSYTTGSGTDEEIILHRSGNNYNLRIYAKIKYTEGKTYLMLSSKETESDCTELTIKMKKLL